MARLLITPGTAEPTAPDAVQARPGLRRASRRWVVLLVASWLCQAGLRAWFGRMQVMPLANPDETAYLIAARVLAGGPDADLSGSTLYPGGYPLLITPVYWFTSNPATVYHAVLMINAAISAAILPLGYLACRRLGLDRPAAYGVATVAALVPAGFFYSQYAMTDAVFPVITLAWLLATHSWLTASSARSRYAAAAGSALLAGFAYMVHSRGLVLLAGYAAVGAFIAWRRPAARGSVAAAVLIALGVAGAAWSLNHYLASAIYPEGARSLSGQMASRLHSVQGTIHVVEMAAGQLWRLVLDSWGIAGIGLVAALAVIARRGVRTDLRIMAGLAVAVTAAIACTAPAALPSDQSQTWASGRYLDGMIVTFFLAGAVVLLRAGSRSILGCAFGTAVSFVVAAATVATYAGSSLPTSGFGSAFNFAEPAVLTQNWTQASVLLASAVTLGLLACWPAGLLGGLGARRAPLAGRYPGLRGLRGRREPGGRGPDDQPGLAGLDRAGTGGERAGKRQRGTAGRAGRRLLRPRLAGLGAAGVPGVLDGAPVLQPGQPAAPGRRDGGRDAMAGRPACPARAGQLAARPGRLASRRRQPGRRLGPLAKSLISPADRHGVRSGPSSVHAALGGSPGSA